ncbi:hypothetical protein BOX15_Mlig026646g3 [Macrostomum lignano]|uniref:Uncharacterized protein n=2 Tax=Macrostomum lignano TaxID=282301 RepID=A0A267DWN7_9PLAT|nr:hypothetical protein BOX15_Mlig026646g2 [Macrostomum lignano]PAA62103.1 hypothetical protein BOX15_Mlig026646g1 [Macrostomum lignano]PAA83880.1 hypothetical protein BOX15_Mlig026646g3 [Macrostomum lignano]
MQFFTEVAICCLLLTVPTVKVCGMAATIDNEDDGDMNQALESQRSIQDGVEGDLLWILKAARRQGKRSSGLQLPAKYSDFVKDWAKEMRYSTTNIRW